MLGLLQDFIILAVTTAAAIHVTFADRGARIRSLPGGRDPFSNPGVKLER